jgi:hypothetical protein
MDLGLAMVIVSSALGVGNMLGDIRLGRGTAVRTRARAVFAAITILGLVTFLGTAVTGSLALYQVALILVLAMPAGPSSTWSFVSSGKWPTIV